MKNIPDATGFVMGERHLQGIRDETRLATEVKEKICANLGFHFRFAHAKDKKEKWTTGTGRAL